MDGLNTLLYSCLSFSDLNTLINFAASLNIIFLRTHSKWVSRTIKTPAHMLLITPASRMDVDRCTKMWTIVSVGMCWLLLCADENVIRWSRTLARSVGIVVAYFIIIYFIRRHFRCWYLSLSFSLSLSVSRIFASFSAPNLFLWFAINVMAVKAIIIVKIGI